MTLTMILTLLGNNIALVLFFYLLYVVGGISQNAKKILQKIEDLEKKMNPK